MTQEILNKLKELNINKDSHLYIDVGTAIDAPNAARWLLNDDKAVVIGIEPYSLNREILFTGRDPEGYEQPYLRLSDMTVQQHGETLKSIAGRFVLLPCAIDMVTSPAVMDFYCTAKTNTGCSSLLEPTEHLNVGVDKIEKVDVVSLKYILDKIQFNGFISGVKTDTQGKDLDVVASLGNYLSRVLFIDSEYNTELHDTGIPLYNGIKPRMENAKAFDNLLSPQGFIIAGSDFNNILFLNKVLADTFSGDDYHHAEKLWNETVVFWNRAEE
jgi:hypothetical protein